LGVARELADRSLTQRGLASPSGCPGSALPATPSADSTGQRLVTVSREIADWPPACVAAGTDNRDGESGTDGRGGLTAAGSAICPRATGRLQRRPDTRPGEIGGKLGAWGRERRDAGRARLRRVGRGVQRLKSGQLRLRHPENRSHPEQGYRATGA